MYRGEFFAMQIDAHVRFTESWDEEIVDQWKSTGNEMAVRKATANDETTKPTNTNNNALSFTIISRRLSDSFS